MLGLGFAGRSRVLMVDLSHAFEMTGGWFEMTSLGAFELAGLQRVGMAPKPVIMSTAEGSPEQ